MATIRGRALESLVFALGLLALGCTTRDAAGGASEAAQGRGPEASGAGCPVHIRKLGARSHRSACSAFVEIGAGVEAVAEQYPDLTRSAVGTDGATARWTTWIALVEVTRLQVGGEEEERERLSKLAQWLGATPRRDLPILEQAPWALYWLAESPQAARELLQDRGTGRYAAYLDSVAWLLGQLPWLRERDGFERFVQAVLPISRADWARLQAGGDLGTLVQLLWEFSRDVSAGDIPALRDRLVRITRSPHPLAVDVLRVVASGTSERLEMCRVGPMGPLRAAAELETVLESCTERSCWALDVLNVDPGVLGLVELSGAGAAALSGCRDPADLRQICRLPSHRLPVLRAVDTARSEQQRQDACRLWRAVRRASSDAGLAACLRTLEQRHGAEGLLALAGDWKKVDATGMAAVAFVPEPAALCERVLGRRAKPVAEAGVEDFVPGIDAVRWARLVASGQRPSVLETVMAGIDAGGLLLAIVTAGGTSTVAPGAKTAIDGAVRTSARRAVGGAATTAARRVTPSRIGRRIGGKLGSLAGGNPHGDWRKGVSKLHALPAQSRMNAIRELKKRTAARRLGVIRAKRLETTGIDDTLAQAIATAKYACRSGQGSLPLACSVGRTAGAYSGELAGDVSFGTALLFLMPHLGEAEAGGR